MSAVCHYCEKNESEGFCEQCHEPVCEECCVPMTLQNQIDFNLCLGCHGVNEANDWEFAAREADAKEAKDAKKKARADARRKAYWKPEAIERRRVKKAERLRDRLALDRAHAQEVGRVMSDMFRGMF